MRGSRTESASASASGAVWRWASWGAGRGSSTSTRAPPRPAAWRSGTPRRWSACNRTRPAGSPGSSSRARAAGGKLRPAGRRFVDEGADFRNYTYARYGADVLRQPGAVAYQLFDAQTEPLLRADEYRAPGATRVEAGSIEELAEELGLGAQGARSLGQTVREFNAA